MGTGTDQVVAAGHPALPWLRSFVYGGIRFMGNGDDDWGGGYVLVPLMRILLLIAVVALLFTARYPKIYNFVIGIDRWGIRVVAPESLMQNGITVWPGRIDLVKPEPPAAPESA